MGKSRDNHNGVALLDYRSVPTSADTETNHNDSKTQKKYIVNPTQSGCVITRVVCCLLMAGVLLLLIGAVLATYFLMPVCPHAASFSSAMAPANQEVMVSDTKGDLYRLPSSESERLPTKLLPVHYRIKIMPFITEDNFTTNGEVIITLHSTENTNSITMHINDIIIHEKEVKVTNANDEGSQVIAVMSHTYNEKKQIYTIKVDDLLKKGELYNIRIKFTGNLNDLLQGFYRISYIDYTNKRIAWMAATQFSPTDARRAFPCLDEPAMKATFTISLARTKNMTSRSNMMIKEQTAIDGMEDWVWDHYYETPKMSTYLVAMMVSDLQPFHVSTDSSRTKSNTSFSVWTRREALEQTRYAGKIGPSILEYFEKYFEIPYPLPKLDMVALPDFGFQAMENWGLITFRESSLLFDEKYSTIKSQRQISSVISHELGHQWFGNLVTPNWWDDLWLKEGFATYTEYLGVQHVQPSWNYLDEFVIDAIHESFAVDSLKSSHPIYIPVEQTEQIRQIFDPISYKKGASVIRMLNNVLGEHTFKMGLINYLNAKKYSNSYHDYLWEELTKQAHNDGTLDKSLTLKQIMDSWILQTGYPVINVTRNYDTNSATITQERFLYANSSQTVTWWVPISYTTSREHNFTNTTPQVWMQNEPKISINNVNKSEWLYVNVKHAGYYRVNYDVENWKMLIKNLLRFPHVIQAQLIDDAMKLARANQLDYEIPFSLTIESFRQTQYVSMSTALRNIKYIDSMLAHTSVYGNFKLVMSQLTNGIYESLGFYEKPSDDYDKKMRRSEILQWACTFENSDCTLNARQLFRQWMIDETDKKLDPKNRIIRTVPPNLKSTVYCTAIREGGEAEWDFAFHKYLNTNSGTERELLLSSLGCASEPWLLSRYLDYALSDSSGIRKQDGNIVFNSVAQNVAGHKLAFNFIRSNWKTLNDHYGKGFSTISKMILALPTYMNTIYDLQELQLFRENNLDNLGTAERAFEQSIEITGYNVDWMANNYKRVAQWLDETIRKYRLHSYTFY